MRHDNGKETKCCATCTWADYRQPTQSCAQAVYQTALVIDLSAIGQKNASEVNKVTGLKLLNMHPKATGPIVNLRMKDWEVDVVDMVMPLKPDGTFDKWRHSIALFALLETGADRDTLEPIVEAYELEVLIRIWRSTTLMHSDAFESLSTGPPFIKLILHDSDDPKAAFSVAYVNATWKEISLGMSVAICHLASAFASDERIMLKAILQAIQPNGELDFDEMVHRLTATGTRSAGIWKQ